MQRVMEGLVMVTMGVGVRMVVLVLVVDLIIRLWGFLGVRGWVGAFGHRALLDKYRA